MAIVHKLGYFAVGVRDLAEATDFYRRIVRLDLSGKVGRTAFLTGGPEHHWIRLEEGNGQGMKRIGYELIDESSFVAVRSGLTRWGIDFSEGGEPNGDGVEHWLRFTDPGGFEIELYVGMAWRDATPPADDGEVTLEKLVHGGWEVTDWDTNVGFYQEVLGFKASDWIGDAVGFFRAGDRYHHSLVLIRAQRPAFNHFCVQVSSLDDVMRFRNNALTHNVKIKDDLLRHAPSGSVGVYVMDEARGFAVEYCVGHPRVDDEDHVARQLPMSPETIDVWKAALPERSPLPGDLSRYDELRG